jgi:hypothetical protein
MTSLKSGSTGERTFSRAIAGADFSRVLDNECKKGSITYLRRCQDFFSKRNEHNIFSIPQKRKFSNHLIYFINFEYSRLQTEDEKCGVAPQILMYVMLTYRPICPLTQTAGNGIMKAEDRPCRNREYPG